LPANQTSFSVTVPELEGKCTTAGQCVSWTFAESRYASD
jgi:hypothetical protein